MPISVVKKEPEKFSNDESYVEVGEWYWVKEDEDSKPELFCVDEIGSNYVSFSRYYERSWSEGFKLHIDLFESRCVKEEKWKEHFEKELDFIQQQIKDRTLKLLSNARKLSLLRNESSEVNKSVDDTLLPSTAKGDLNKFKRDLIKFRDKTEPQIQEEIEELIEEFTANTNNMILSVKSNLGNVKRAINKVEDAIFTVELYAGIQENVKQIKKGKPASIDEKISIRQQLLYMDEECLIDFDKGGMDFENIRDFDKWVVRSENLQRILPEEKAIVAFRVRRDRKDYGIPVALFDVFTNMLKDHENMKTYLLIRNGNNVYRIASAIDFSPHLVPFKDEVGEKQFIKVHERYTHDDKDDPFKRVREEELITKEDVRYDDHKKEMDYLIKKYNRIFILIQGLLDRSTIFHPHVGIKLSKQEHVELWIDCIRDEELGLASNLINFEEYRDELNKTLKKGKWVYSSWVPDDIGRYDSNWRNKYYTLRESEIVNRPSICKIASVSRDKTKVRINWEVEGYHYGGRYDPSYDYIMTRHLNVPIEYVFNVTDYNPGDYKMFLCDRSLQGQYLKWAPQLLSAEKFHMEKVNDN